MSFSSACTRTGATLASAFFLQMMIAVSCMATPAQASTWRDAMPQARVVGAGDFRWFGLRIYTANLWSERQPIDLAAPFALELTYHLGASRQQIVATSIEEIDRLFGKRYSAEKMKRWEGEMQRVFIDVESGDQLVGVFVPNQGCRFYSRSRLLGDIRDPEFASAFFSIWFDPRAKKKQLRAKLLGVKQ